jgi:hypothetical protein
MSNALRPLSKAASPVAQTVFSPRKCVPEASVRDFAARTE